MKTSRVMGTLLFHTIKPFQIAKGGSFVDQNEIILKEINYETESVAYDIEQLFDTALMNTGRNRKIKETDIVNDSEYKREAEEAKAYYAKEEPTEEEIIKNARQLQGIFKMQSDAKMSELKDLFLGIVDGGLILINDGTNIISMTQKSIWPTINKDDRLDIIFAYISFFVQPLKNLEKLVPSAEN